MSFTPFLSNGLSPRPCIHTGELTSDATAVTKQTNLPRLRRVSGQRLRSATNTPQPRGRASSDVLGVRARPEIRERSTSFGSTQEFHNTYGSVPVQRLNRNVSERKVHQLLKLRKKELREARRRGDEAEIFRLKNLNLFDQIIMPRIDEEGPKEDASAEDFTTQNQIKLQDFTSHVDVVDVGFPPQANSVNQEHTATLCWHLKLEYAQGLTVPDEFTQCTLHPTPSPCASSSPSSTVQPASRDSLSSGSTRSLRRTQGSSIGSSTLRASSEHSSPSSRSSISTTVEPSSPAKQSSIVPEPDEEDPFLYIAKSLNLRAEGGSQCKKVRAAELQAASVDVKRSFHTKCTCTNHRCRTYLSGPPSKHCRFCKLPRLQLEIAAVVDRVEEMKASILTQADANLPAEVLTEAEQYGRFEALQEDVKLVEMYNSETEKRCGNGVWWEGWLIEEDLKRQGIVGSK